MIDQFIVVLVSSIFAFIGIKVLIASFDDDYNDGDGMIFFDNSEYHYLIPENS